MQELVSFNRLRDLGSWFKTYIGVPFIPILVKPPNVL